MNSSSRKHQTIGLGGGCHWCTEAVFQQLVGVYEVKQGFIKSDPPNDNWSEAIEATFDPQKIQLENLIEIHLRTHASTSQHSMRGKYRSAVYGFDDNQVREVNAVLQRLQCKFEEKLITSVLNHRGFKSSDERFHNYYESDPERPFCKTYIDPKLKLLRDQFSDHQSKG